MGQNTHTHTATDLVNMNTHERVRERERFWGIFLEKQIILLCLYLKSGEP